MAAGNLLESTYVWGITATLSVPSSVTFGIWATAAAGVAWDGLILILPCPWKNYIYYQENNINNLFFIILLLRLNDLNVHEFNFKILVLVCLIDSLNSVDIK